MNKTTKKYLALLDNLVYELDDFETDYVEFLDSIYMLLTEVGADEELSETDKLFLKVKIHKIAAEVL